MSFFEPPIKTKIFLQQVAVGQRYIKGQKQRCITLYGVNPDKAWAVVEKALKAKYPPKRKRR